MNEQTTQLLAALAAKMDTTVEHLWGALIKQAYIYGVSNCTCIIVAMIALFVLYRMAWNGLHGKNKLSRDFSALLMCGWCMLAFIFLLVIPVMVPNAIGSLLNPEYWAMQQLRIVIQ
jgi:uncharacterized membrane-anchored protein